MHASHDAGPPGRHQHLQRESPALIDRAQHVARLDAIACRAGWREQEAAGAIERGGCRARLDEGAGELGQPAERTADAVDDGAEQSRAKLDRQRRAVAHDTARRRARRRLLEHLKRRRVAADAKHLGEQLPIADPDELVRGNARRGRRLGQRADHARQPACLRHRGLTR